MADLTAAAGGRRWTLAALAVLLLLAAFLRLWYLPGAARILGESAAVASVEAAVAGGDARPRVAERLGWYPQKLLLAAAQRRFEAAGGESLHAFTAKGRVTRAGLHLARLPSVLYGLAGALLLFLVARRLHGPLVALLAVLVLALSPWHIRVSTAFTPDALVVALSLLALWLGMRALDRPSPAASVLVGLTLGAAAAARWTGALVAPAVLLGLWVGGRRPGRRRLAPLVLTVAAGLAAWWLLVPPLGEYAGALEAERAVQVKRAARETSSRFTVAVFAVLHPLRELVHGRILGTLALLGFAGQAFRCLFLVDPGPARPHRLMVVAAMPLFALGYAWATPRYEAPAFAPLVAYSSLYAAVTLGLLRDALAGVARGARARRAATAAVAVAALALAAPAAWRHVYASAVRSTAEVALDRVRRELAAAGPRIVVIERAALGADPPSAMRLAAGLGLDTVERLSEVDGERLGRADAEIFPVAALDGPRAAFYRGRLDPAARRLRVDARALRRRGPDLMTIVHPYGGGPPEELELELSASDTRRVSLVPASPAGATAVSLVLRLPPTAETAPAPPRVWLGGGEIRVLPAGFFPRHTLFVSDRLPPAGKRPLMVTPPEWMARRRGRITAAVHVWR